MQSTDNINLPNSFAKENKMVKSNKKLVKASIVSAAAISFLLSVYLWFTGSQEQGIYVGLWVPSILSFGTFVFAGGDPK
jgi:hypothetical protein